MFDDLIKEDKIELQVVEAKLSVLELLPGDIVVFRIDQNLPTGVLHKIGQHLRQSIPNNEVLVLSADTEITILRDKS